MHKMKKYLMTGLALSLVEALTCEGDILRVDSLEGRRACGEESSFRISYVDDKGAFKTNGTAWVVVDNFGPEVQLSNRIDFAVSNPVTVTGALKEPGFLRVSVDMPGVSRNLDDRPYMYSVPYEQEMIEQGAPEPADFDAFWAKGMADLAAIPLDAQMKDEPRKSSAKWTMYRVSFASIGRRVNGWLSVPKPGRGPWPALVSVPGAGCDQPPTGDPNRVVLRLSVFPYELSLDKVANRRKFDELNAGYRTKYGVPRYPFAGMDLLPREYFYYPVILGAVRAVRWLAERPEVDRAHISYSGSSQGGAFGLYLAGLAGDVFEEVYAEVPALTDTLGWLKGRVGGWPHPELEWFGCDEKARDARIVQVMPYFDGCNFAARAKCPVRIVAGLADWVCPPSAVCAAYNRIPRTDRKLVLAYGGTHHSAGKIAVEQEKCEQARP